MDGPDDRRVQFPAKRLDACQRDVAIQLVGVVDRTPRYHHIHHSDNPAHYKANLAALFTIWDRLFGTYVNPDDVKEPLSFGIGENVPLVRLAIGV